MFIVPSGSPTSITSTASNDSILLAWQPPPPNKQNGIIIQYHVILYTLATNESEYFETNETSIYLVNLHPFFLYEMVVAAETSIGAGPYSQPVLQQLPEASKLTELDSTE